MEPVDVYKNLGTLAIALLVFSASWVLWTAEVIQRHRSISTHVAQRRVAFLLFAATSTVSAILMYIFLMHWFIPTLQLPPLFTFVVLTAQVTQLIAAWVPHTTGWMARVHNAMVYVMAVGLILSLPLLLFSPVIDFWPKALIAILFAWMAGLFASLFITPQVKRHFLPLQSTFLGSYFVALLVATYTVG